MINNINRIKIIGVLAVFLILFMFNPSLRAHKDTKQVSVGLTLEDNSKVTIAIEEGDSIINESSGTPLDISNGDYTFSWHSSGIKVDSPSESVGVFSGPLLIPENKDFHRVNGTKQGNLYRGALKIIRESKGLLLINIIDLEEYLYGVLPREMPPSWGSLGGMDALKAQAIAARTYALVNTGRHQQFDLCDTVHCQVYGGVGCNSTIREHDNTNRAVDATRGEVLTYQGRLITPLYHATNGGYTEVPQNVWNPNFSSPIFESKEDPFDDHTNPLSIRNFIEHNRARWHLQLPAVKVEEFLHGAGVNVGRVSRLEVKSRFPSKRVNELVIQGTEGQESLLRESARVTFGLNSQMFYVEEGQEDEVWVKSAEGRPVKESLDNMFSASARGSELIRENNIYALSSSGLENVSRPVFLFTGWGWGHGIGMSQNGAYNRSRYGQSYSEILEFYYNGARIVGNYNR